MEIYVAGFINGSNLALISIIYGKGFPIITFLCFLSRAAFHKLVEERNCLIHSSEVQMMHSLPSP